MNKEDTHARIELVCRVADDEKWKELIQYLKGMDDISILHLDKTLNSIQVEVSHRLTTSLLDLQRNIEKETKVQTVLKGIGDRQAAVSELIGSHGVVGVVRLSQLIDTDCLVDGAIEGLPHPDCSLNIHSYGDLSGSNYENIGPIHQEVKKRLDSSRGYSSFHFLLSNCDVTSSIGRTMAVSDERSKLTLAAGIVARASTVGQNTKKQICLCSGKTIWQERDQNNRMSNIIYIKESDLSEQSSLEDLEKLLEKKWTSPEKLELFRFYVTKNSLEYRKVDGNFLFVAQMNEGRGILRRRPQCVIDLRLPFNENLFNFTKITDNEILFKLKVEGLPDEAYILINNSPIEYCSSLLVPDPHKKYPQILTRDSIISAITFMACCRSDHIRMGFNSLGAAASVNHLHWHVYPLDFQLKIEETPVDSRGILSEWPLPGFAFDISEFSFQSFYSVADKVIQIVDKCYKNNMAYNCFITRIRGSQIIRFIIWPRKPELGLKNDTELVAAFCEFSGFFICKTRQTFDTLTEDGCIRIIRSVQVDLDIFDSFQ